jgi:general secretion pathway protein L
MDAKQKRRLGWIAAALVIVSLAIPSVQLAQYHWAASAADEAALANAATIVGEQGNPGSAERALDQRLIAESRGNIMFPIPASALYSALQQVPNVSITRMAYDENGIVSATLSAIRNEDINPALLAMQEAGFIITATPRTDATGSAQADITVRAP